MISIIKLTSSETLLARQSYRSNDKITVIDPLKMEFINDYAGPAMHSTFWIPLSKEEISVDIDMEHVIISVQAPKDLADFYTKSIKQIKSSGDEKKNDIEEKVRDAIKQFTKKTSNTASWTLH